MFCIRYHHTWLSWFLCWDVRAYGDFQSGSGGTAYSGQVSGCPQSMGDRFSRGNCSGLNWLPLEAWNICFCSALWRSWFQCIVTSMIRAGVIWVLACQRLMSLHFPALSWRDALSLIGVWGERKRQKKAEEQKCLSNFSIIPQTPNALDMIIMFVHFLATCYTNKTVKSWLAWRLHETDTVLSCLCCWKFIPIESAVPEHWSHLATWL